MINKFDNCSVMERALKACGVILLLLPSCDGLSAFRLSLDASGPTHAFARDHGEGSDWDEMARLIVPDEEVSYSVEAGRIALIPTPEKVRIVFEGSELEMGWKKVGGRDYLSCQCGEISSPRIWTKLSRAWFDTKSNPIASNEQYSGSLDCAHVVFSESQVHKMVGHKCKLKESPTLPFIE